MNKVLTRKKQFRIKNLPDLISNIEAASKHYFDIMFNYATIIGKNAQDYFNDNVCFVKLNSLLVVREHLTQTFHVDEASSYNLSQATLLRLDPSEKMKKDERVSIILDFSLVPPKTMLKILTKRFVDSLSEKD